MLPLDGIPAIGRIKEKRSFLQALLPEFTLTKSGNGVLLEVTVKDDDYCVYDSAGKRDFFATLGPAGETRRQEIAEELSKFAKDDYVVARRFDCSDCHFRYASGGVLPIVRLDGVDHFCLMYREVFPIGWNIANGGSDTLEELLLPERIIFREFGEELFIADQNKGLFYTFESEDASGHSETQSDALKAWIKRLPERPWRRLPVPLVWYKGPDQVCATVREKKLTSDGYFLTVAPGDNGIELDRIALINLGGDISLFDGEYQRGRLVNRPVGLFPVDDLKENALWTGGALTGTHFIPKRLFIDGKPCSLDAQPEALLRSTVEDQLQAASQAPESFRTPEDVAKYKQEKQRFTLCPVTRSIIQRYFGWLKTGGYLENRASVHDVLPRNVAVYPPEQCDVFLSFKSEDLALALNVYTSLAERGLRVFCSAVTLPQLGVDQFTRAIGSALKHARCLVVLGSRGEYFESPWVSFEWSTFLNELVSRRKEGRMFTYAPGVGIHNLPLELRGRQSPTTLEELYTILSHGGLTRAGPP